MPHGCSISSVSMSPCISSKEIPPTLYDIIVRPSNSTRRCLGPLEYHSSWLHRTLCDTYVHKRRWFSPCYGPDGALIKPKRAAKSVGIIVHARHIPYVDVSSVIKADRCIKLDLCINKLHYRFISCHLDPYGNMEALDQQYKHLNSLLSDVSVKNRVVIGMDSQCTLSQRKLGESPALIGPSFYRHQWIIVPACDETCSRISASVTTWPLQIH